MKLYTENRRARHDYEILDSIEAGVELRGFEVKAVKAGRASLGGSFGVVRDNQLWLLNADIPPYQPNNTPEKYSQKRTRRLLVKKEEVQKLMGKLQSERLTIVPLKLYNKAGLVKIELGLARGKKKHDKREAIKKRETGREIRRTLKKKS